MLTCSLCFGLWLRIDELVNFTWSDIDVNQKNYDGVPLNMVKMRDRKYERSMEGQSYELYKKKRKNVRARILLFFLD